MPHVTCSETTQESHVLAPTHQVVAIVHVVYVRICFDHLQRALQRVVAHRAVEQVSDSGVPQVLGLHIRIRCGSSFPRATQHQQKITLRFQHTVDSVNPLTIPARDTHENTVTPAPKDRF